MRALKLTITPEQHLALLAGRRSADRDFAERCLYVLLNVKGLSTYQIAELLIRDVRVVRHWLKAYDQQGLEALHSIKGAGGRPRTLRDQVQEQLEQLLTGSPKDVGLHASHWTRALLAKACENKLGRPV